MKKILLLLWITTILMSCSKDDNNGPSQQLKEVDVTYLFDPGGTGASIGISMFKNDYVSKYIDTISSFKDTVPKDSILYVTMSGLDAKNPSLKIIVGDKKDTINVTDRTTNGAGYVVYKYNKKLDPKYFIK